jgi:hypothetical protein
MKRLDALVARFCLEAEALGAAGQNLIVKPRTYRVTS